MDTNLEQTLKSSLDGKDNKKLNSLLTEGLAALELQAETELEIFLNNLDVTEITS
jgi:hypothetical protein